MQKINRHNYEAYLLDYMEGNLCPEDQHDLFVFLAENPGLKIAAEADFGDVVLIPEPVLFDGKPALRVAEGETISLQNVDQWMIESVEGNLATGQEKELADFVRVHRMEKTMLAYQSTRLKANADIVFINKRALKVETGRVIPIYMRWAAAAAGIMLLVGVALNWTSPGTAIEKANGMATTNFAWPSTNQNEMSLPGINPGEASNNNQLANVETPVPQRQQNGPVPYITPDPGQIVEKTVGHDSINPPVIPFIEEDKIVKQETLPGEQNEEDEKQDDVAVVNTLKSEQPYKIITDAASNVINRDVNFTRQKDLVSNEYVAYQFKLGNFEFERKKSR